MEDDLLVSIKQKQNQWMRERAVDIERQKMPEFNSADMVNALTDKLVSQLPAAQKKIEKNIADELETNTCSICFELMLPKEHSPILLFPCGHTFCKKCLDDNLKKTGRKICPWCRAKIKSTAMNLSLQNLIVAYAKQKDVFVKEESVNNANEQDYLSQLKNYNLRCRLLENERENAKSHIGGIQLKIEQSEGLINKLKEEEEKALARLRAAEEEVELVRKHQANIYNTLDTLNASLSEKLGMISLIDETMKPLAREQEKILTLINIQYNQGK